MSEKNLPHDLGLKTNTTTSSSSSASSLNVKLFGEDCKLQNAKHPTIQFSLQKFFGFEFLES